jgi:hypothetical protein
MLSAAWDACSSLATAPGEKLQQQQQQQCKDSCKLLAV